MLLMIPDDLNGPIHDGFRFYRHAPPTGRFLALARSGKGWTPAWPRRVVRLAARYGVMIVCRSTLTCCRPGLPASGGRGASSRRLLVLIGAWRPQHQRGFIYQDHGLLVFEGEAPHRWSAPKSALRTTYHTSPIGPPPVADAPEAPQPAPAPPSAPSPAPSRRSREPLTRSSLTANRPM
jgi:hypothetical protein